MAISVNDKEAAKLLANLFAETLPGSGADLLDEDIEITGTGQMIYLNVSFSATTGAVLTLDRTVGTTTVSQKLNGAEDITADTLYVATIPVCPGEKLNFTFSGTGGTYTLAVAQVVQYG